MKKIWIAVGLILALLAIYFVAQALVGGIFGIGYAIKAGVEAGMSGLMPDTGDLVSEMTAYMGALTPWIIIIAVVVTLPFYYLIYRKRKQELQTFISVRSLSAVSFPVLVIFALSVNVIIELLLTLASMLPSFSGFFEAYDELAGMLSGGSFVISLIAIGIVGPVFEEILFRGLIFGELRKIMRVPLAIVIQALLFGLYHMNVIQGSYALLIGLLLGFVYYRSNSMLAPVIVHIGINSSSVILSHFASGTQLDNWGAAITIAGVALFFLTGAFLLLGKSFRRGMDNSLYEQNRLPKPPGPDGGLGPV